jgi:hypothetical protein
MVEFARSVFATVSQVAAPSAESERTNWLVQEVPVYSATIPVAPVRRIAEVIWSISSVPEIERLVEVAFVVVPFTTARFVIVEVELFTRRPPVAVRRAENVLVPVKI